MKGRVIRNENGKKWRVGQELTQKVGSMALNKMHKKSFKNSWIVLSQ